MSQPQRVPTDVAQRLQAARNEWGWSQEDLAREIAKIRAMRGLDPHPVDNLRRQIVDFEQGKRLPKHRWRTLLADALQQDYDALFGAIIDAPLPRPLLLDTAISTDVIAVIDAQRHAHVQVEHLFGPAYAHDFIDRDLSTIETFIKHTPAHLRSEIRQAAGRIAEVAGWIAQDSGDHSNAERFTHRADDYLRAAGPELRALVLMRRSNIAMSDDPDGAVELATEAANLIEGRDVGRLAASIARQQALAAEATRDRALFERYAAHAIDLADVEAVPDDHAIYATRAYVASEIATGYLHFGQPDRALALLQNNLGDWPADQQRDHGAAQARLLHVLIQLGDYHRANEQLDNVLTLYRAAPSHRARRELRHCRELLRSRARTNKTLPLVTLRSRIETALRGDRP
ncbi:helix-turn-helix transcriptional regulator [Mycobacterium intracellulare]